GQWTVAGTPPARPDRHRRHDGRHGSSGPPAARDAHRFTGEHPSAAAKTVRAATEQNALLLTHQERYRVIVPDLLGYGYSARPGVAYTREFYLLQPRELIDELGVDGPVHLAGASFGGIVVAEFAAENPGDVASMPLMAPAALGRGDIVNPVLSWPVIGDRVFRVLGAKIVTRWMAAAYSGSPDRPAMLDWMAEQSTYRGFAERMLNSLRHYDFGWRPDVFQALGRSGIPVFAAWGADDTVHPYERTQVLQRYVPQTTLVTLDRAGHAITNGRAEQVLAGYGQFLRDSAR
ncbi:MAG: hypothetical protein QOG79_6400, partial [Mycobacterium sp.]|nr:hypothetical protein [Mycobacterium sp.]